MSLEAEISRYVAVATGLRFIKDFVLLPNDTKHNVDN